MYSISSQPVFTLELILSIVSIVEANALCNEAILVSKSTVEVEADAASWYRRDASPFFSVYYCLNDTFVET